MVAQSMDLVPIFLDLKPSNVTLSKSLNFSFLQFAPLKNGDDDDNNYNNYLTGWFVRSDK